MAGVQSEDNPVAINITAMVDVIFCLCLFFMCSFQFKQLEGKFESWLPKYGVQPGEALVVRDEIRVFVGLDGAGRVVRRVKAYEPARSDEDLASHVSEMADGFRAEAKSEFRTVIDCEDAVPWQEVIRVFDLLRRLGIEKIDLAAPVVAIGDVQQ